jgi:hypothetical protein
VEAHRWPHADAGALRSRCAAIAERAALIVAQTAQWHTGFADPMTYAERADDDCGPW